jgi:hypothetical protein
MSVGLQLHGELPSVPAQEPITLQTLETWLRRECQPLLRDVSLGDEGGAAVLLVELHPAAEALRIWSENGVEIAVSAQTSSAGPGYHIYVCDLLTRMSRELGIRWKASPEEGDETGYFESADESSVYREMLEWLGSVCDVVLRESDRGCADLAIAMPTGVTYRANQFLITQMGPRSRQWAEAAAHDDSAGKDFFAWWGPKLDARYYFGRALCLMWTAVRWRPPVVEAERKILMEVCENLDLAHRLDGGLEYPWREWAEILEYLGTGSKVPRRIDGGDQLRPFIGYRRNPVRVSLVAGWTIEIPGRFAESWKGNTWCAWDLDLTVWITAFKSERDGLKNSANEILSGFKPDSEDIVTHGTEQILGKGSIRWVEDDGQRYWRLRARSAADGRFCLCTICYSDSRQMPLALEIWKSLRV